MLLLAAPSHQAQGASDAQTLLEIGRLLKKEKGSKRLQKLVKMLLNLS